MSGVAKVFALRRRESLAEAFRRIAAAQLTRAAAALTAEDVRLETRIHDARKRFKESRALVRLFRAPLGDAFDEENRWYRDAGRALAAFRDATAAVCAIDALPPELRRRLRPLVSEPDAAAVGEAIANVIASFDAERQRIETLQLRGGAGAVEKGFAATLAAGRKAMAKAYETRDAEAFHEWRKRVKDHWYHVQLFLPVWPELMTVRHHALRRLSHLLGEHHDLGVVAALAPGQPDVARFLATRQRAIVRRARPLAEKLYAVRPRDAAREVLALWRIRLR
jgi:CHAD domain-containing protein